MLQRKDFVWPGITFALLLAIAITSGWLRGQVLHTNYSHPDEEIARAVVTKVLATKTKDTNWARTDVDKMFRYNQFNFSAYYLAAAKIEKLGGHALDDRAHPEALLQRLRQQSIWWASFAVLLGGLLGWRLAARANCSPVSAGFSGITTALLTSACVTLFQDSIYARPEAFVTVLTLSFVLVLLAEWKAPWMLALSGALLGILIATKITFIVFLPFPPMVVAAHAYANAHASAHQHAHAWRGVGLGLLYLSLIVAGFGLGAPYALFAPWEYLDGVGYLLHQYNGEEWLRIHGGMPARIAHGVAYLVYTDGIVTLLLACAGVLVLLRRARHAEFLALAGPLLTLIYFLQTRAFFERNFSHALPVLFATSSLGLALAVTWLGARSRRKEVAQAFAACSLLVLAFYPAWAVSAKLRDILFDDTAPSRIDVAMRKASGDTLPVLFGYSNISQVPLLRGGTCGKVIYKLLDLGDPVWQQELSALDTQGYHVAARTHSPFDGAPYSTLQAYHSSNVIFLAGPPDPDVASCRAELIIPTPDPRYAAVDAMPTLTGQWARDAVPADMSLHGWTHAFYASWNGSDANTGEFALGPFEACGELVVPYAVGPARDGLDLTIERELNGHRETIVHGAPPPSITWTALRIAAPPGCASYTIHAMDHGTGYGQWLGVGIPVELRPAAMTARREASPTLVTNPKPSTTSQPRVARVRN